MKVYLIKTPDYEEEKFKEVTEFLEPFEGALEFTVSSYKFDVKKFPFLKEEIISNDFDFADIEGDMPILYKKRIPSKILHSENRLSFDELYSLCNAYRTKLKIEPDSFVVLLTKWGNEFNFFSSFNSDRNVFVHVDQWEIYTNGVDAKYPIAFQIVENILSSLMNIGFDAEIFMDDYVVKNMALTANEKSLPVITNYSKYVHEAPVGCINDFCRRKKDIINKLQSVNTICLTCLNKINEEVDSTIFTQAISIFAAIRNEFTFKVNFLNKKSTKKIEEPYPLIVEKSKNGKFRIFIKTDVSEIDLRLDFRQKMLYIFFLERNEGVLFESLPDHFEKLLELYKKIRLNVSEDDARNTILSLTNDNDNVFKNLKANINKEIRNAIGIEISNYYTINHTAKGTYSISVPRELVDLRF